ncbi:MAG TPA: heavy metal translocating P-type ATPase, partial [Pirellulaceae bacterium]|nr:heavy metal translocating P-type ATPase [Pirellulaceae bacterium]
LPGADEAVAEVRRLAAPQARRYETGVWTDTPASDVRIGDRLLTYAGERFAADGRIVAGHTSIDESMLTGEAAPRDVEVGDAVFAGTVNLVGAVQTTVTARSAGTRLGAVADLISQLSRERPGENSTIDCVARHLVPALVCLALSLLFITHDSHRAVTVIVVGCPCALALSTPAVAIALVAAAGRRHILVKSARSFESLAEASMVVFDKTGTVTTGRLAVVATLPATGVSEAQLRATAARCARGSRHPVSVALSRLPDSPAPSAYKFFASHDDAGSHDEAGSTDGAAATGVAFREWNGLGIEREWRGTITAIGKPEWFVRRGYSLPAQPDHAGPIAAVVESDRFLGYVLFADELRPEAAETIASLRSLGIARLALVTGDHERSAEPVAKRLGFDVLKAGCTPEDKVAFVRASRSAGERLFFVGDGLNDSAALLASDAGIAVGGRGWSVAQSAADVVFLGSDLRDLAWAVETARRARAIARGNLRLALGCSLALLAGAVLGVLGPLAGAIVHHAGSVAVLANSARLLRVPFIAQAPQPSSIEGAT